MYHTMESVCSVCIKVRNETNRGTSFKALLAKLRKNFKKQELFLDLRSHRKSTLDFKEFYVNAYYDPENDRNGENPFEVIIFHNFNKHMIWDQHQVTDLLEQVFDAIIHEFRHQKQSRKRRHKSYWTQSSITSEYLSDPDEVDAYAVSIAIELCRNIGKHRAISYMHRFTTMSRYRIQSNLASPNLFAYVKVFEDLDHPVLKKLAKKIYKRLIKIDTDHIFV